MSPRAVKVVREGFRRVIAKLIHCEYGQTSGSPVSCNINLEEIGMLRD